jgi:GTP cyclohydrolase I
VDVSEATPEQLFHYFLLKVCPEIYDPQSEHFAETPRRFTQMVTELTNGSEDWRFTTFKSESRELVVNKNIKFVSLCAHHVAPFAGVCHLGYIPDGQIAGLSKFARLVQATAHSLTDQEELTTVIADQLEDILHPLGVAVVMEATHSCMTNRGALAHGTETTTSAMRGIFLDNTRDSKSEFFTLLYGGRQ